MKLSFSGWVQSAHAVGGTQGHRKPAEHAEVVFPAQESQFGIAKLFLSFPPLRKQYWLSRKHEGPKGREGGQGGVNQTKASLLSRLGKFGARDGEILDRGARS